jgi:hypothetical protein
MRFQLLLFIIYRLLKRASTRNRSMINYIGGIKDLRIMIKTADGKIGRLFVFREGEVSSISGGGHEYDAAIVWSDPKTAFRTMTAKNSDEAAFLAAAEGRMKVDGMVYFIQWFGDAMKIMRGEK